MLITITIIITIISLAGVILNVKKRPECFYLWAVANVAWAVIDFKAGLYAQSALFIVYFFLAIWGIYEWQIQNNENNDGKIR